MSRASKTGAVAFAVLLALATTAGAQNPGQFAWGSYVGTSEWEEATAIAVDATGAAYLAGTYRPLGGLGDGFLVKMSADGASAVVLQLVGGSGGDTIYDVLLDAAGNIYVAGRTDSWDFPTTPGAYDTTFNGGTDLFVAKFDPTGTTLLFSTVIGGSGFDATFEDCLCMDASGNLFLTGQTQSWDLPVTPGAYDTSYNDGGGDSFVVKLAADGSQVLYATYLGGSAVDNTRGIAVNASGEVYLKGFTFSGDFPTTPGAHSSTLNGPQDFFITKLNAAGSGLVYSTYLGGSDTEASSYGSLVLTGAGEVYVSGHTTSPDFPATPGAYDTGFNGVRDGFVAKLDAAGQLVAATFLGGRGQDGGNEITLDAAGNVWWTATAGSDNFPTTPGAYLRDLGGPADIILACLDGALSRLEYCTFLGGYHSAETFLAIDPASAGIYVWAGVYAYPEYPEFPTTAGAYDTSYNGDRDGYIAKIDPTANMGDTDGDGMPDWWELLYSFDPNIDDAANDADADGASNLQEYVEVRNPLSPQNKYRLGPATELLDAAFYAGEAADGSDVAGRWAYFGRAASDNQTVAFWAANVATNQCALFLVDIGDPSSWRRLTPDINSVGPLCWTPDDQYILALGCRIPRTGGTWTPYSVYGYPLTSSGIASTRMSGGNWLVIFPPPDQANGDLLFVPILPNADTDWARNPVQVTDMKQNLNEATWHDIRPDGSMVAFQSSIFTEPRPDDNDLYVLKNVAGILNGSIQPPLSLADPNVVPIRTAETENCAEFPYFSEDGSLVIYSEESSRLVRRTSDIAALLFQSDWDVVISNADGSGPDYVLAEPDNQAFVIPTPGGMRLLYIQEVQNEMHLMVSTLEVAQEVAGTPVGAPEDNAIVTTTAQTASDASGTTVEIPAATTVDFPAGAPQAIEITTPIDPATEPQLPPYVEAIAVVREFGPEGTQFSQPIPVTITYTDAEVAGLDEAMLRVFQFNPATGLYDLEVTTIVNRDLVNNTITFTVTHFSTYGLGIAAPFSFTGFLSPIGGADATGGSFENPLRAFKLGSTIPVAFRIANGGGAVLTGIHTLQATKYSSTTDSEPPIDATPTDAATTGNRFRLTEDGWKFNLSTKAGFSQGVWLLTATLSDGTQHTAWICIKK